jgi:hypothetical protein
MRSPSRTPFIRREYSADSFGADAKMAVLAKFRSDLLDAHFPQGSHIGYVVRISPDDVAV